MLQDFNITQVLLYISTAAQNPSDMRNFLSKGREETWAGVWVELDDAPHTSQTA